MFGNVRGTCVRWLLAAAAAASGGGAALAQPAGEQGLRVYQEQLRVQLDQQQAIARQAGFDAGGWFSFALFDFDDAQAGKTRVLREYDLRLWGSFTLQGVHTFYVRGRTTYDDWNSSTNPRDEGGDEFIDPALERAWYKFDYNRMVRNKTGANPAVGGSVEVGRDYYTIGSGFVLALPLDAVQLTGNVGNWEFVGLLAKTITHTPNVVDASDLVVDHMDRCFYGLETRYKGLDRHQPYVYHLWQDDHTRPWGKSLVQTFDYDSNYLGAGSRGSLLLQNLRYGVEAVFEYGHSTPERSFGGREDIHALGLDALLEYLFDVPRHPRVTAEYMFGSGDSDRRLSSSATVGGNQLGTRDTAFNMFGFRDTGLAFAPRISNLHIWAAGASFFPAEQVELCRKMEVGTKVFFYAKDAPGGAISDPLGADGGRWVGWEWDAFVNWRITSDLSWTIRYGVFQPGDAFAPSGNRDCRNFIYTGLTYSF